MAFLDVGSIPHQGGYVSLSYLGPKILCKVPRIESALVKKIQIAAKETRPALKNLVNLENLHVTGSWVDQSEIKAMFKSYDVIYCKLMDNGIFMERHFSNYQDNPVNKLIRFCEKQQSGCLFFQNDIRQISFMKPPTILFYPDGLRIIGTLNSDVIDYSFILENDEFQNCDENELVKNYLGKASFIKTVKEFP